MAVGVVVAGGLLYAFGKGAAAFALLPLVVGAVAPKLRQRGAVAELTAAGFSAEVAAGLASAGEALTPKSEPPGERHSPREVGALAVAAVLAAKAS